MLFQSLEPRHRDVLAGTTWVRIGTDVFLCRRFPDWYSFNPSDEEDGSFDEYRTRLKKAFTNIVRIMPGDVLSLVKAAFSGKVRRVTSWQPTDAVAAVGPSGVACGCCAVLRG